jgi:hypothetical protein
MGIKIPARVKKRASAKRQHRVESSLEGMHACERNDQIQPIEIPFTQGITKSCVLESI